MSSKSKQHLGEAHTVSESAEYGGVCSQEDILLIKVENRILNLRVGVLYSLLLRFAFGNIVTHLGGQKANGLGLKDE